MGDEAFGGAAAKGIGTSTTVTGGCQTRDGPSRMCHFSNSKETIQKVWTST
jgi:hypothetical protein